MRKRYVQKLIDGKWTLVEGSAAPRTEAPCVVPDSMPETWHPADGKHYDSKSKFRRVTRAHGCIEVGNEKQKDRRQFNRNAHEDVRRAIEMVRQGHRPRVLPESLD